MPSAATPAKAKEVKVSGDFLGEKRKFTYDVNFPKSAEAHDFIPRLWAARRVGYLLDEIRLRGENAELDEETTRLARKYGIVTPYTAYLILEDEKKRDVPVAQRNFREMEADARPSPAPKVAGDRSTAKPPTYPPAAAMSPPATPPRCKR